MGCPTCRAHLALRSLARRCVARRRLQCAGIVLAACAACAAFEPEDERSCRSHTSSVAILTDTVYGGILRLNWTPRCAIAKLSVEDNGVVMWSVATGDLDRPPEIANRIRPSLLYGFTPLEAAEEVLTGRLVAGRIYRVYLWRMLPTGSTARCEQRVGDACLIADDAVLRP